MNELKPCPFCGGKAKMHDEQVAEDCVEAWVICTDCGASSGRVEGAYSDRPTATAAWNRRHEMPKSMVHRLATQMGWSPPSTPKQGEGRVSDLQELRRLAEAAATENDVESDWFDAELIESDEPICSSRKARRFIAAMTPHMAMRLIMLADGVGIHGNDAFSLENVAKSVHEALANRAREGRGEGHDG